MREVHQLEDGGVSAPWCHGDRGGLTRRLLSARDQPALLGGRGTDRVPGYSVRPHSEPCPLHIVERAGRVDLSTGAENYASFRWDALSRWKTWPTPDGFGLTIETGERVITLTVVADDVPPHDQVASPRL